MEDVLDEVGRRPEFGDGLPLLLAAMLGLGTACTMWCPRCHERGGRGRGRSQKGVKILPVNMWLQFDENRKEEKKRDSRVYLL